VAGFEQKKPTEEIPVLRPAFKWAQSLKAVWLEVKFATRFDQPACVDLSNEKYEVSEDFTQVTIEALCTNDRKPLLYRLVLDLWDAVMPTEMPEKDDYPDWVPRFEDRRRPPPPEMMEDMHDPALGGEGQIGEQGLEQMLEQQKEKLEQQEEKYSL